MKKIAVYTITLSFITYFTISYTIITNHNLQVDNALNKVSYGEILDQAGTTKVYKKQQASKEYYNLNGLIYESIFGYAITLLLCLAALNLGDTKKSTIITSLMFIIQIETLITLGSYYTVILDKKELTENIQTKEKVINYILNHPEADYKLTAYNNNKDFEVLASIPGTYQDVAITILGKSIHMKKELIPEISTKLNAQEVEAINNYKSKL